MIRVDTIFYSYAGKQGFALKDLTLGANAGEIFTLLGPNGAGKTTLLRIISGLIVPQEGCVSICGFDMRTQEYQARACIGLVLGEERSFYYRLSGAQNLQFFGGLYGIPHRELKRRIDEGLDRVGLAKDADLQYMRYSTGMKKRLGLARALLHDPRVLLLDEPNSGIDPQSARTIRGIILDLKQRGKTILLTTHDMTEAERLSDRIGFLKEGKLVRTGTVEEFRALTGAKRLDILFERTSVTQSRANLAPLIERLQHHCGCQTVTYENDRLTIGYNGAFDMNAALTMVADSGLTMQRTDTMMPSLEEVFIKLAEG